ncbi:MAG: serine/threonine protein kinase [Phycisphaera sp.]|nr:serine/threonine protein kinase [Phycisphaera sp.]
MMERNLRTRLQAARWLLDRVSSKSPEERRDFLRSETDDALLIELVEGLLETHDPGDDVAAEDVPSPEFEIGDIDALELLREINGVPRRLGEFDLSRPVGRGGMGSVYLAEHRTTGEQHAVKVAVGDTREAESIRALFREAEIMQSLRPLQGVPDAHPAQLIEREGQIIAYYGREFVRGTGMGDWVAAASPDLERVLDRCLEVCRIVEDCHRHGVAHCDIKPSNMLVGLDETSASLIDFGLAVWIDDRTGLEVRAMGHPAYTAPEACLGGDYDPRRSDQFSLGLSIFSMLRNSIASDIVELPADVGHRVACIKSSDLPLDIRSVLVRMCSLDPMERFPSVKEAAIALRRSVDASVSTHERRLKGQPWRQMSFVGVLVFAMVLSVAFGVAWGLDSSSNSELPAGSHIPAHADHLDVAMAALDGGDVATAVGVLADVPPSEASWLAGHLRARLRAIYTSATLAPESDSPRNPDTGIESIRRGDVFLARDAVTGDIQHRWPAHDSWTAHAHADGALIATGSGILDLDVRRAAASTVVARDAIEGSLFWVGDDEIGWISRSGTIVIRAIDRDHRLEIPLPSSLDVMAMKIASDGWSRMVLATGERSVHVFGLGPGLGMNAVVPIDGSSGPTSVLGLGRGRFLLHNGSEIGWILEPGNTVRKINLGGPVLHAVRTGVEGAAVLVGNDQGKRSIAISSAGVVGPASRPVPVHVTMLAIHSGEVAYAIGAGGLEILSGDRSGHTSWPLTSLEGIESLFVADSQCILLGGRWGDLWIFDPGRGGLRGRIDTGGTEIQVIVGTRDGRRVFTQDRSGFVRRIAS